MKLHERIWEEFTEQLKYVPAIVYTLRRRRAAGLTALVEQREELLEKLLKKPVKRVKKRVPAGAASKADNEQWQKKTTLEALNR